MKYFNIATTIICTALLLVSETVIAQEKSRLDEVRARGKVIVGTSSEAPPFGFIDEKGNLVGFDIDIGELIAKQIFGEPGHIEFVKQGFAARWPNVQSGKVDFGIQVTTINGQRPLEVAFTRGYIDSTIVLISKKASGINTVDDANRDAVTVANLTVPVQTEHWKQRFPKAKIITFDTTAAQFTAVKTGRAAAAQLDIAQALYYVKQNPEMQITRDFLTSPSDNAIFSKKGDFQWWLFLDTTVAEMRGGYLYDDYAKIYEKWFGQRPPHAKYYVEMQMQEAEKRGKK
jgi:polar amino acid transport system substrate-binding protein